MNEPLTAAQMRAVEQAEIASGKVTGLQLMERAGQGVVDAILAHWPEVTKVPQQAIVLCGPGNNGGDGFVVARLLHQRGWTITALSMGATEDLPSDARVNADRWAEMGPIRDYAAEFERAIPSGPDAPEIIFIIDALFGIGQRAPLDDVLRPVHQAVNRLFEGAGGPAPFFVSVDVPTGLDADTGAWLTERPFPADLVVTLHSPKPVHQSPSMIDQETVVVDIGL